MRYLRLIILFLFASKFVYPQHAVDPNYVFALHDEIVDNGRYKQCSDTVNTVSLPFGIVKEIGATKYIIAIDSVSFFPSTTYLRAYMAMEFPQSGERIAFAAQHVQFNPKGVAVSSFSRLLLVSKHVISIGPRVKLVIEPDGKNFVEWDCNGYKGVNLNGYFEFSNSMLMPDSASASDSVVRASFNIYTQDLHNFIAQVSISPFTVKGLKDFSFSVLDATVDMSELINAPGMAFPADYTNKAPSDINEWTGFFLKQVKVKLPPELSKGDNRIEIYAANLLIDNAGVSGVFGANNILSITEGNMSGWGFSVDNLSVGIVANKLNGGSMYGSVLLPIANQQHPMKYNASIMYNASASKADYVFSITPGTNISVPAFSATMDIYNTSVITVGRVNGRFKPSAVLNGKITIAHETAKLKGISFEQLVIVNEKPYITNAVFALVSSGDSVSENHVSKYPVSLNNFLFFVSETSPSISFDAAFNFMSKEDKGFAAVSTIRIIARVDDTQGGSKLSYDRIVIGSVALNSRTNFYQLSGIVNFNREDPVYGNGFFGSITMQFDKFINSPVTVTACFGNKDDYKYWFADAAVPIKFSIGSGLSVYRLKGGLRYHMNQSTGSQMAALLNSPSFNSPLLYVPDKNSGIAFVAGVTLAPTANDKTFNGDVAFEITFNSSGGLNTINFSGDIFSMISIDDRLVKSPASIPIIAVMRMTYDHTNSSFHALLNALINTNGIKGTGQCIVHFDPEIKYMCIGKPSARITVSLANTISMQSYFMMGNRLEPMPPPPALVAKIVGSSGIDKLRDESILTTGKGFVFGASFNSSIVKEKKVLDYTAYGKFAVTVGFDMMILDYGGSALCSNSGIKPGINGWYSTGQVYAAMQGAVGISGEAAKQKFNITILSGEVAALLYAQLPKPYYFEGRVGCSYEILSLIRGNFDFDFSLGEYCNVVN